MINERFILTGASANGTQYKITDTDFNYRYKNNKEDKQNLCDLLNNLVDENERLRKAIDEADDLIKSHLTPLYNRRWETYCKNLRVDLND